MNVQMIPVTPTPSSAATTATMTTTSLSLDSLKSRLRRLNLYGLLAHAEQILAEPWIARVLEIEESERQQRSSQAPCWAMLASVASNRWPTSTTAGQRSSIARCWRNCSPSASSSKPPTS